MNDNITDLPIDGPGAPPRRNGELAFDEPWQGRSMALAVLLCEEGHFTWPQFQEELILQIGQWEAQPSSTRDDYRYWDHWQASLEVLAGSRPLTASEIKGRAEQISGRPHGWDH